MTDGNSTLPDQTTSASRRVEGSEVITRDEADITLDELESHLFECADIIRNRVDKTDYKEYILPLVFYKAFQDTYQDNYERVLREKEEEGLDHQVAVRLAHDEAFHEYVVPKDYRWNDLITANNSALAVDDALRKFEELNDQFDGISTVEYSDVDAFTQPEDNRLEELLRHLNDVNLSRYRVPPDMLGEAYMDLVKHFAQEEGRDGGEFFTPPEIVELMVKILEPYEKNTSVHDPTCGSGGMLVQVAEHLQKEQQVPEEHWRSIRFTGQEVNPTVYAMAQMNLAIHDVNGEIRKGDSLGTPQFTTDENNLELFNYILANFPFSTRWPKDNLKDDPYGRFSSVSKLPHANRGDYAFIMHMISQLDDDGAAAIVVPNGVLFRKHEKEYRKLMVEEGMLDAIIELPENLFQNTSIQASILVLDKTESPVTEDKVLFLDLAKERFYTDGGSNQYQLTGEALSTAQKIYSKWKSDETWNGEERLARAVPHTNIEKADYNLNLPLYVDTTEALPEIDIAEELEELWELEQAHQELTDQFKQYMGELGYE